MFGRTLAQIQFAHVGAVLVVLAFVGLVIAWFLNSTPNTSQSATATTRATTTLGITHASTSVRISATLEPSRTSQLSFKTGGRITSIRIDEGVRVRAGEPLARVSVDELQAQRAQAKANLRAVQAKRQKVSTGTRSEQIAVYSAQLEEAKTRVTDQESQLGQVNERAYTVADEAVRGAADRFFDNPGGVPDLLLPPRGVDDDTLESIRDELNTQFARWQQNSGESAAERAQRAQALLDDTAYMLELLAAIANRSDVRVDTDKLEALSNARERVASSKTSLSRARTALSSAETAASVATQRLELAEAGSRSEDITAATAAEEEARAKIDELTERIEEGTVTAPYSGVITDVTVESGELAQAGSPVMTVIDDTSWLARGEAASRLAPALDEGQPVTITPTGYTRSFAGELATVMPALRSGSGALVLEVRTNALPNTTKAGQAATVRIPLSQQGDSLYFVPREFVGFSYDGPFVETVGGQRYPVDVRSSTEETFSVAAPELRASTTIIVP